MVTEYNGNVKLHHGQHWERSPWKSPEARTGESNANGYIPDNFSDESLTRLHLCYLFYDIILGKLYLGRELQAGSFCCIGLMPIYTDIAIHSYGYWYHFCFLSCIFRLLSKALMSLSWFIVCMKCYYKVIEMQNIYIQNVLLNFF